MLPGETLLLAAGDNVGASPPNSALLERRPGHRRRERVGHGRHGVRQPRVRLRGRAHPRAPRAGELPVPVGEHRRGGHRAPTAVARPVGGVQRQRCARRRHRRRRCSTTPELVRAGRHRGSRRSSTRPRGSPRESERLRKRGVQVQVVVIHEGAVLGNNRVASTPPSAWQGPIMEIVEQAPEERGRPRHRRPHPPHRQHRRRAHPRRRGRQRGRQLLRRPDGRSRAATSNGPARPPGWPRTSVSPTGPTCRRSSTRPTPRRRSCATRSSAPRQFDIRRDPTRLNESAMGNMVGRRDARQVPGRRGGADQLRRPAPGHPSARRRRAARPSTRSRGARSSPSCRSATGR